MKSNRSKQIIKGTFYGLCFGFLIFYIETLLYKVQKYHIPIEIMKDITKGIKEFVAPIGVIIPMWRGPFFIIFIIYCFSLGGILGFISSLKKNKIRWLLIFVISLLFIQWCLLIIADINLKKSMRGLKLW